MKPTKYMAQTVGAFGVTIAYSNSLKQVIKKARIFASDSPDKFGIFTVRDGGIIRINRNGAPYS